MESRGWNRSTNLGVRASWTYDVSFCWPHLKDLTAGEVHQ